MTERRPAQTIGELDIHLSNLQSQFAEFAKDARQMATKQDIESIRATLSGFATKRELTDLEERLKRDSPSTLWANFAKFAGQATIVAAALVLASNIADRFRAPPPPPVPPLAQAKP